ncbi:unnamed protein product [Trichogramma brassicae]|uniref:Uncharacterized protein n=1 Tax=Trichogramma brassicae TaxID=86971 RepID=A0A6H5HWU2_9HYME|nr:unnamed protein product [Trichogramma brassicae]
MRPYLCVSPSHATDRKDVPPNFRRYCTFNSTRRFCLACDRASSRSRSIYLYRYVSPRSRECLSTILLIVIQFFSKTHLLLKKQDTRISHCRQCCSSTSGNRHRRPLFMAPSGFSLAYINNRNNKNNNNNVYTRNEIQYSVVGEEDRERKKIFLQLKISHRA